MNFVEVFVIQAGGLVECLNFWMFIKAAFAVIVILSRGILLTVLALIVRCCVLFITCGLREDEKDCSCSHIHPERSNKSMQILQVQNLSHLTHAEFCMIHTVAAGIIRLVLLAEGHLQQQLSRDTVAWAGDEVTGEWSKKCKR